MWFSEAKKHESCNVYDSNHAKMSNICRKIFFSDIGIVDKKQEYTICRRRKKNLRCSKYFWAAANDVQMFQPKRLILAAYVNYLPSCFVLNSNLKSKIGSWPPFLVPKIIFFGWINSGSVHTITYFFPRTSLQLCIVCHGTSCCDRWKIIEIISLHLFCIHAISISVSVAGHVLNIHKKNFRIVGFPPWKTSSLMCRCQNLNWFLFPKREWFTTKFCFGNNAPPFWILYFWSIKKNF